MKSVDQAIFIGKINYSETSVICTFYTLKDGMQTFLFQGGKKKAAALYPLALTEITHYSRPDSELWKLTEAKLLDNFEFRFNPIKSSIAFFCAQVLKSCLRTNQSDPFLFEFICNAIEKLESKEDQRFFPINFLIDLSFHLGIEPLVENEGLHFNLNEGELTAINNSFELTESGPHVKMLSDLYLKKEFEGEISKQERLDALQTLIRYYEIHITGFKADKTLEIIQELLS